MPRTPDRLPARSSFDDASVAYLFWSCAAVEAGDKEATLPIWDRCE
jgi:hypothetical protein